MSFFRGHRGNKKGGSRHAKRARKAKPHIGTNGVYVKSRKVPKKAPRAIYANCHFCGSYSRLSDEEEAPIVWTCILGCEDDSTSCVKCFPLLKQPQGAQLLPWDIAHWTDRNNNSCQSFEGQLSRAVHGDYHLAASGVPSPRDRPWEESATPRDAAIFGALCAERRWREVTRKPTQYRQLASVVRRIAKYQQVPVAEIRSALIEAELATRGIEVPDSYRNHPYGEEPPSLLTYIDDEHKPTSALACAAIGYMGLKAPNTPNNNGASVGFALAATKLAALGPGTQAEMAIRTFLPRWTAHGGSVTNEVVDAAAAAWCAGHRIFAQELVKRETTGRKRKTRGENSTDSADRAKWKSKKKRRRGPSARGRRK